MGAAIGDRLVIGWSILLTALAAGCASMNAAPAPADPASGSPHSAQRGAAAPSHDAAQSVADGVRFMQHMIHHHLQAVEMTDLVPARSASEEVRRMAHRIAISQEDELATMRDWLDARGAEVSVHPGDSGDASGPAAPMPGMLTRQEMELLAATEGPTFDRLFLEAMIRHHEGALLMVEDLFARGGASQDARLYDFAAHVDADQRMEISRMRNILERIR